MNRCAYFSEQNNILLETFFKQCSISIFFRTSEIYIAHAPSDSKPQNPSPPTLPNLVECVMRTMSAEQNLKIPFPYSKTLEPTHTYPQSEWVGGKCDQNTGNRQSSCAQVILWPKISIFFYCLFIWFSTKSVHFFDCFDGSTMLRKIAQ